MTDGDSLARSQQTLFLILSHATPTATANHDNCLQWVLHVVSGPIYGRRDQHKDMELVITLATVGASTE